MAHIDFGLWLMEQGQTQEGLEHLQKAVQLRPDWGQSYYWLSRAYSRLGRNQQAAEAAARAAHLDPHNAKYLREAAVTAQRIPEAERRTPMQSSWKLSACK